MKTCSKCCEEKPLEEFSSHKSRKDGKHSLCKVCKNAGNANPPEYHREWHLRKVYGLTLTQYDQMCSDQQGKCAICGVTPQKRLVVDHNHDTDEVRGLLCSPCNMAIGSLQDSPDICISAALYLLANTRKEN